MSRQPQAVQTKELIETLWNVNRYVGSNPTYPVRELIETLWNVNAYQTCSPYESAYMN